MEHYAIKENRTQKFVQSKHLKPRRKVSYKILFYIKSLFIASLYSDSVANYREQKKNTNNIQTLKIINTNTFTLHKSNFLLHITSRLDSTPHCVTHNVLSLRKALTGSREVMKCFSQYHNSCLDFKIDLTNISRALVTTAYLSRPSLIG